MIPASLYRSIYLILVTILTIYIMPMYSRGALNHPNRTQTSKPFLTLCLCAFMILFIGFRPTSGRYFVDMGTYSEYYNMILGDRFYFDKSVDNLFYDNWFAWMASQYVDFSIVMLIFAAIYFGMMYIACRKMFPRDTMLAFIVYLAAFSTFSYATNGMKAGMAASTFLVALAYYDKLWLTIPLALFTYTQHHSMSLVIASYFLVLIFKNPKYYFAGWFVTFIIALLHIKYFQIFFAGFTDEHGAGYLLSERNSGFRIDFVIYSVMPVIIGYLMIFEYNLIKSKTYNILLNLYLTTNSFWMLCMYSNVTNRISYLSWFLYPFVILYPFVNIHWHKQQASYLGYIVYGHLGFTLFMNIVYYGLLSLGH